SGHVPPAAMQAALADFIGEGHYGGHVRRMRALYAERRSVVLSALEDELSPFLRAAPGEGGLQLSAFLPESADDRALAEAAMKAGLHVSPLSLYRLEEGRPGLYMGYASVPEAELKHAAASLADVLRAAGAPRYP
ncbi:MAG: PLP-dependent aminotransferase family protein, partial [Alphaproteobacteria bacterium]